MEKSNRRPTKTTQKHWFIISRLILIIFKATYTSSDTLSRFITCVSKCQHNPHHTTILTQDPFLSIQGSNFSSGNMWAFRSLDPLGDFMHPISGFSSLLIAHISSKNQSQELVKTAIKLQESDRYRILIFLTDELNDVFSYHLKKHFSRNIYHFATIPEFRRKDDCKIKIYFSLISSHNSTDAYDFLPNYTSYERNEFCEQLASLPLMSKMDLSNNVEIRASAVDTEDSNLEHLLADDGKGNLKLISGTSVTLLNDLRAMLNFRIKVFRGEWIKPGQNNSVVGNSSLMLINDELDIHISHTTLLPYRAHHFDFLQPTITGGIVVFLTQPEDSYFRDVNTAPFTKYMWYAVLLTILTLTVAMKIGCALIAREHDEYMDSGDNGAILWGLSVAVQQGWFISSSESISLKIILTTGSLFGLLCYTAYSAEIVSILASDLNPISTLSQLISSNIHLFGDKNSSTISTLVEELTKDQEMKMRAVTYVTRDDGVFQLLNVHQPCAIFSLTLFFYRTLRFYNVTDQWMCKYMSDIPVNLAPTINSMVIRKNSIFREVFNYKIMWLKQIGLNHRYLQEYNHGIAVACTHSNNILKDPLGISDLRTAYLILGAGCIFSLGQLVAEKILFYFTRR